MRWTSGPMRPVRRRRDGADPGGRPARSDAAGCDVPGQLADAMQFRRGRRCVAGAVRRAADATVQFRAVGRSPSAIRGCADATMQFRMVSQPLADATMPFRMVSQLPTRRTAWPTSTVTWGKPNCGALIRSILADLKPREREVIELSFRHDLYDNDLAIALGVSSSRAQALAARTRGRLEKALGALRIALTGRQACPVLGELLADWDGQLTEQTRDLVGWHIEQCQTCAQSRRGARCARRVFPPAAAGPAPSGTAGAGLEPLYLHR